MELLGTQNQHRGWSSARATHIETTLTSNSIKSSASEFHATINHNQNFTSKTYTLFQNVAPFKTTDNRVILTGESGFSSINTTTERPISDAGDLWTTSPPLPVIESKRKMKRRSQKYLLGYGDGLDCKWVAFPQAGGSWTLKRKGEDVMVIDDYIPLTIEVIYT
jgi:hypothetical protein